MLTLAICTRCCEKKTKYILVKYIHNIANNVLRDQCKAHRIYVHSQLRAGENGQVAKRGTKKKKEGLEVRRQLMVSQIECSWMGRGEGVEGGQGER